MSLTLFGLPLPSEALLVHALPQLFGIGSTRSREICQILGFPPALRIRDLTPDQEKHLAQLLKENYTVAGHLEEDIKADFHRLFNNGSQRGYRLRSGLPVRGQRTRSNSQTARRLRGRKS